MDYSLRLRKEGVLFLFCIAAFLCFNSAVYADNIKACINNFGEIDKDYRFFAGSKTPILIQSFNFKIDGTYGDRIINRVDWIYVDDSQTTDEASAGMAIGVSGTIPSKVNGVLGNSFKMPAQGGDWECCGGDICGNSAYGYKCHNTEGKGTIYKGSPIILTSLNLYTYGEWNEHDDVWRGRLFKICVNIVPPDADNDGYDVLDDCDDTRADVYPGAPEICDGVLNNCDGPIIDAGCDTDRDDYCDATMNVSSSWISGCVGQGRGGEEGCCEKTIPQTYGTSLSGDDCNDNNRYINPGAQEMCYSENNNDIDDDCDDGKSVWDNKWYTGINEGCEDDNWHDCESNITADPSLGRQDSGFHWIGVIIDGAGQCCGNNTYPTVSSGTGHRMPTEFFPFWNLQMAQTPSSYQFSGCWDSMPVRNNEDAAVNLIYLPLPGSFISSRGRDYTYTTQSTASVFDITEEPVNVIAGVPHTLISNMSLFGSESTFAKLRYSTKTGSTWSNWIDTGVEIRGGEKNRLKMHNYTPANDITQLKFQMMMIGPGTMLLRNTGFYMINFKKVLNSNGSFYGCDISQNMWLMNQIDTYSTYTTGNPILAILPQNYYLHNDRPDNCSAANGYFCSYKGYWKKNVDNIEANKVSRIPETKADLGSYFQNYYIEQDCCPPEYCWDGIMCHSGNGKFVGLHIENTTVIVDGNTEERNYKCIWGSWQNASLKPDQDNMTSGYCGEYQCFYKPVDGSSLLCVDAGNYTFDDYCLGGKWSSRTALIAMQLINLSIEKGNGEYVLFCDKFENALNDYYYVDPVVGQVIEYIVGNRTNEGEEPAVYDCGYGEWSGVSGEGIGCTNNFCVIKYTDKQNNEKVAFGTSLNIPIDSKYNDFRNELSFLKLFDARTRNVVPGTADHYTFCDAVIKENNASYLGCDGPYGYKENEDWDLWYNTQTMSLVYSPQKVNLMRYSAVSSFIQFLKMPFTSVINAILSIPKGKYYREDYSFLSSAGKFRKLYMAHDFEGTKSRDIKGIVEKSGVETGMVVDYNRVGVDICKKVDDYNKKYCADYELVPKEYLPEICPMSCEPYIEDTAKWSFHVESKSEGIALWPELIAKMRLKGSIKPTSDEGSPGDINCNNAECGSYYILNPINFSITKNLYAPSSKDTIAYTWDFGDGAVFGTAYEDEALPVQHTYTAVGTAAGLYAIKFRMMDKDFNIYTTAALITIEQSPIGGVCTGNNDCQTNYCNPDGRCSVPSCTDGWKNKDETDVDCGGSCGSSCMLYKICSQNSDCLSYNCVMDRCWYGT